MTRKKIYTFDPKGETDDGSLSSEAVRLFFNDDGRVILQQCEDTIIIHEFIEGDLLRQLSSMFHDADELRMQIDIDAELEAEKAAEEELAEENTAKALSGVDTLIAQVKNAGIDQQDFTAVAAKNVEIDIKLDRMLARSRFFRLTPSLANFPLDPENLAVEGTFADIPIRDKYLVEAETAIGNLNEKRCRFALIARRINPMDLSIDFTLIGNGELLSAAEITHEMQVVAKDLEGELRNGK